MTEASEIMALIVFLRIRDEQTAQEGNVTSGSFNGLGNEGYA